MEKKKILVTGGTGLVGTSLKNYIIKNNLDKIDEYIFLSSKECNLINYDETENIFQKIQPSHVIHLAVKLMAGNQMMNYPVNLLLNNIDINTNVLKCCHKFNIKKCINVLSSFAYPKNASIPIDEDQLHEGKCHENYESYAFAKRHLEILARSYRKQYNCNFINIIPSNIFGPIENAREDGPVVEALIKKCYNSKKNDENIICRGSGKSFRQFCYAPDLARVLLWTLENYNDEYPINITGIEISIKELLKKICKNLNIKEHKIIFDTTYPDGPIYRTLCDKKINNLYKEYKFTDIDEALNETINSIKNI